jgi:hypothetical protein
MELIILAYNFKTSYEELLCRNFTQWFIINRFQFRFKSETSAFAVMIYLCFALLFDGRKEEYQIKIFLKGFSSFLM